MYSTEQGTNDMETMYRGCSGSDGRKDARNGGGDKRQVWGSGLGGRGLDLHVTSTLEMPKASCLKERSLASFDLQRDKQAVESRFEIIITRVQSRELQQLGVAENGHGCLILLMSTNDLGEPADVRYAILLQGPTSTCCLFDKLIMLFTINIRTLWLLGLG